MGSIFFCLLSSTIRRPVRVKPRLSIVSMQSVSTVSSEEGNTSEVPCSSQRSTLDSAKGLEAIEAMTSQLNDLNEGQIEVEIEASEATLVADEDGASFCPSLATLDSLQPCVIEEV